ncbi:MAG: UDP-3-O-(3-hydroxymyristoyl)glucosamine N-acyltransferase, partial [Candidatus Zixiibacteriota bacterium]
SLDADAESLVFISPSLEGKNELVRRTRAGFILCDKSLEITDELTASRCFIIVGDPKLQFARIGNALFRKEFKYGIHPTAYVSPEAQINEKTHIGPFTYVGKCEIAENTIIEGHCHLYDKVNIGRETAIQSGAIIGADGYGHVRDKAGQWTRFPHAGGVIIEDNVEIGANSCIDRGNLRDTIIRAGTKINNLVHIAHNVVIGYHCLISVSVNINGSAVIGDGVYVGSGASIRDGIKIGNNAFVGMAAAVVKDVPDGVTVVGIPAKPR